MKFINDRFLRVFPQNSNFFSVIQLVGFFIVFVEIFNLNLKKINYSAHTQKSIDKFPYVLPSLP